MAEGTFSQVAAHIVVVLVNENLCFSRGFQCCFLKFLLLLRHNVRSILITHAVMSAHATRALHAKTYLPTYLPTYLLMHPDTYHSENTYIHTYIHTYIYIYIHICAYNDNVIL